jgi:hypothetical protein
MCQIHEAPTTREEERRYALSAEAPTLSRRVRHHWARYRAVARSRGQRPTARGLMRYLVMFYGPYWGVRHGGDWLRHAIPVLVRKLGSLRRA